MPPDPKKLPVLQHVNIRELADAKTKLREENKPGAYNSFLGFLKGGGDGETALGVGLLTGGITAFFKGGGWGLGVGLVLGLLDYLGEKEGLVPNAHKGIDKLKKGIGTTPAAEAPAGH